MTFHHAIASECAYVVYMCMQSIYFKTWRTQKDNQFITIFNMYVELLGYFARNV